MKKLISVFALLLLLSATFAQTTYYISNDGDDTNSGTSSISPWKTISQINSQTLVPGDSVLFRRGDVWRETLYITASGSASGGYIVYSNYGTGTNPQLLGSDSVVSWSATGTTNIWVSSNTFTNPRGSYSGEVFFEFNDSVTWGSFKDYDASFSYLVNEYDWTWDSDHIYIYATSDPSALYDRVEVPQRDNCARMLDGSSEDFIEFNGIDLHYSIQNGFNSGYPAIKGATNITFRNCDVSYIGEKGSGHAYGLAVWQSNTLIENCTFSDCGRRAISFVLYTPGITVDEARYVKNIVIRNNIFKRGWHTTSLDLEAHLQIDTIVDIYFYNNIIDDRDVKLTGDDEPSNQIFEQNDGDSYINNLWIFNNVFSYATGRNILLEAVDTAHVIYNTIMGHNPNRFGTSVYSNISFNYSLHIDYRNNIMYSNWENDGSDNWGVLMEHPPSVYIQIDNNLYYQDYQDQYHNGFTGGLNGYYTISDWSSYITDNPTFDQHSPTPANPQFVSSSDFELQSTSPAIGGATPIEDYFIDRDGNTIYIGKYDINGNLRDSSTPSIGAYENNGIIDQFNPTPLKQLYYNGKVLFYNGKIIVKNQ